MEVVKGLRQTVPQLGTVVLMREGGGITADMALTAGADAFVAKAQATEDLLVAVQWAARLICSNSGHP
jgi:hypothetical protein